MSTHKVPSPVSGSEAEYWDAASFFENGYVDWEGLVTPDQLELVVTHIRVMCNPTDGDYAKFVADMTLHWVFENIDQGGYTPTENEIQTVYWAFFIAFQTRRWMMSDVDWGW